MLSGKWREAVDSCKLCHRKGDHISIVLRYNGTNMFMGTVSKNSYTVFQFSIHFIPLNLSILFVVYVTIVFESCVIMMERWKTTHRSVPGLSPVIQLSDIRVILFNYTLTGHNVTWKMFTRFICLGKSERLLIQTARKQTINSASVS